MTFHGSGAAAGRRRRRVSFARIACGLALALASTSILVGCKTDGYELPAGGSGGDGDGGSGGDGDGGGGDGDGGVDRADARLPIDACPNDIEGSAYPSTCDGHDNDCDGQIDEDFDLQEDNFNCGACGNACDAAHTTGDCIAGVCDTTCKAGWYNYDADPDCEYQCVVSNGGVEICNDRDEDCDGVADDGINKTTDENNCGGCGVLCAPIHATPRCQGGVCGYTSCDPGYADVLPNVPGCEYPCPENPPLAQEECDGEDDDCDGTIDELPIGGLGTACSDFPQGGVGDCVLGHTECSFGAVVCVGDVGPHSETCDDKDNDCNGVVDNGFNKNTDEYNCGSCGHVCDDIPHAVEECVAGACQIFACDAGYVDSDGDGDPAEGCDYLCTPTGPEVCDSLDNDCDRKTDSQDPSLQVPPNFCRSAGRCSTLAGPTCGPGPCDSQVKWRCIYGGNDQEVDNCGNLLLQETQCDNRDGDCDGRTDEAFPLKTTQCSDGQIGACQDFGTYVCKADETGLRCNAVDDDGGVGAAEQCDNDDDDCDGVVDDGAPAETVRVDDGAGGLPTFYIYAYEASHPDADDATSGSADHRTCSKPGVMPWRLVSRVDAEAACAMSGRRLCSEAEWELACETLAGNAYPYGDPYEALTCNGRDYDTDPSSPGNQDALIPTGELDQCFADWADGPVFDLSGNLKEWTSTEVVTDAYRVRGGSYDNIKQSLTCEFDFISFDQDVELPNLGFRCCSATP